MLSKLDETVSTAFQTHQIIFLNVEGDQFIAVGDNYLFSDNYDIPGTGLYKNKTTLIVLMCIKTRLSRRYIKNLTTL